jgi:hypothetical protein
VNPGAPGIGRKSDGSAHGKRARRLVDILEGAGPNCGLVIMQGAVVMRCPGTPFTDLPIPYDEADSNNAVELNLLEKKKMLTGSVTGSSGWEWYVVREKAAK